MIRITEQITVNETIDTVFDYVGDFSFIEQWDPSVTESRKVTPGPLGVGTRYGLKLGIAGFTVDMDYRISEFHRPARVVLVGRGDRFGAIDTIRLSEKGNQTTIDYQADIEFDNSTPLREAVLSPLLKTSARRAIRRLQQAFNRRATPPANGTIRRLLDKSIIGGMVGFAKYGFERQKKRWAPMPAFMHGKTAVVTGATSGIGLAVAKRFAALGARVVMVGRNSAKSERVRLQIIQETGNPNVAAYIADLSLMDDVRRVAGKIIDGEPRIHILVNNAGALFNRPQLTGEGLESTVATNLLSPYLLTTLLKKRLGETAPARVINVSSGGMYTQKIQVDDLEFKTGKYDGPKAYARAKRGLVILTEGWAESLKPEGISVHAMHPGWVATPGLNSALPSFGSFLGNQLRTPDQGADTIVWLATAPEAAVATGKFWLDREPHTTHVIPGTRETGREREELWRKLDQMAGGVT